MTVTIKDIVPTQTLPTASTTLYTCGVTAAILDKWTAYNSSASVASTITVSLGGVLVKKTLQPEESYTFPEISGHSMVTGQTIVTTTTVVSIVFHVTGREVT